MILLVLALVLQPIQAPAQALESRVAQALADQGFVVIRMERTWLGRLRVVAESATYYRELVFDPATGEILNDYVTTLDSRGETMTVMERSGVRDRDPSATETDAVAATTEVWVDVVTEPDVGVVVDLPDVTVSE
jgi:hypothetical protein